MAGEETKKADTSTGSQVRQAFDTMGAKGAKGATKEAAPTTTARDIGTHPAEEDQPVAREIHLFAPDNLDRAVFCRQLATMIEVGIPLLRALQLLSKRTSHPKLGAAIARVAKKVEEGQSVSQAMKDDEKIFSPIVCNIVRVGEVGGILEGSLVRLAQIMETKAEMNRKIRAAMMYPLTALAVAVVVVGVIMVKAVPVFTSVYGEAGAELPGPTKIVIGISAFSIRFWPLVALLVVGAIVGISYFSKTPPGRRVFSLIALRGPVVSRITKKIGVARFSRTLSGLLTAGVPLVEGLSIAAETNENVIISETLHRVHRSVEKGEKIGPPLARSRIFPLLTVDMISIGEETGTLDRMLERVANIYDAEVDSTLRGLSTIIEPLLIVLLGGVVIFIALAVMLPYFNLGDIVQ